MKQALSILLIFFLGLTMAGVFPIFKLMQYQARKEIKKHIKEGIPKEELCKIIFAANEKPDWVREGKEFRYRNQMFDVVGQEYSDGQTIYYCINDHKESQLFAHLDTLVEKQMHNKHTPLGTTAKVLLKLFSQVYIAEKTDCIHCYSSSSVLSFPNLFTLSSGYVSVITPPPDIV